MGWGEKRKEKKRKEKKGRKAREGNKKKEKKRKNHISTFYAHNKLVSDHEESCRTAFLRVNSEYTVQKSYLAELYSP